MVPELRIRIATAFLCMLSGALPESGVADTPYVPDALVPWVDWVLHDQDVRACPLGSDGAGARICAWPGRLALALDGNGGRFEQVWTLYAEDWVPLPGGGSHWPEEVNAGEQALAVVEHRGGPAVRLEAGTYRLNGRFSWTRRPEVLPIPNETGLLALRLDGTPVAEPRLDDQGRLWLGRGAREEQAAEPDTLSVDVVRRLEDEVPLRVLTRIALDVSGQTREIGLGPILLAGGIPIRIDSPLPARLDRTDDERGLLRLQLRPGRWTLMVESHHRGPVEALTLDKRPAPWPTQEVWVFSAHNDLRQVELGGAPTIDPRQARLPDDWRGLPAYLL
ncbi:MAG: hypothetical protein PVH47_03555, partial [Thiohalocapsa sp.]